MKNILTMMLLWASSTVMAQELHLTPAKAHVDFGSMTSKDYDDKTKTQEFTVGRTVTKRLRTELDLGFNVTTLTMDKLQATAGFDVSYAVFYTPENTIAVKTGYHYQMYSGGTSNTHYSSLGVEFVHALGKNKKYVVEVSKKLNVVEAPFNQPYTSGWVIITGIRYQF